MAGDISPNEVREGLGMDPITIAESKGAWTGAQPNFNKDLKLNTYGEPVEKDLGGSIEFVFLGGVLHYMHDRWNNTEHHFKGIDPDSIDNSVGCNIERSGRRLEDVDARYQEYLDKKAEANEVDR